ncbi:ABC transporter permease subunit [Plantactinospora sp. S1510]|uniref:ABC transporter permease subunit n=1 Tax=Plantactinospora alkalitolerans TaxID=2789879 RepID=A0ABS0GWP2_9ACTN|nr:ABC transporter permease subunit [Plantactinospora alkalitolerans]MBF9130627.1 ABC transporter permease subunit [Plantactinospora alkalitolerans]
MIWLTWRQHRKQALFALAGLAALAAFIVPTGLAMRDTFAELGLPDCVRTLGKLGPENNEACLTGYDQFISQYGAFLLVGILFLVLPLLVGLFWGAPLIAREVEQGTHRLVWTQGVSRHHWALVKFGLIGTGALIAAIGYGLGVGWWLGPLNQVGQGDRFDGFFFDMQGLVPVGYTLFAVALGVFAGTVWPRVLPAMAGTLVGFLGLRIGLAMLARPHYLPAETLTFPVMGTAVAPNATAGDWVIASGVRNAAGELVVDGGSIECPPNPTGPGANCGADLEAGTYNWQLYQPADRFWLFQGIETGIFVALAALLLYLAIRRIRRIA